LIRLFEPVPSPPAGLERPTGRLTPPTISLLEDTLRLPPLFHLRKNIYTEQILSGPGPLIASMAGIADVVRSIVVVALNDSGSLFRENGLDRRLATSPLG
jgi:hypothetical protein